jgi:DNA end-binding protein Ku
VLLTDEEIRAIRLESTRTIDIERFVDAATIDRIWWDEPYYLVPSDKSGAQAFAVIREAMEKAGRIGLGRVVMHTRERIVAIEPRGEGLLVTTLRAADEVRDDAALFDEIPAAKVDRPMLQIAGQIIAQLDGKFDPSEFRDRYEDALRELIRSKDDGGDGGVPAAPPAQDNVIDLMEALRRSLGRTETKPSRAAAAKQQATAKRKTTSKKPAAKTAAKRAARSTRRRAAG